MDMIVLTPGHKYIAANFEDPQQGQTIQFIEKDTDASGMGNNHGVVYTVNDGTTNEELLAILIDRLNFLNAKFPCRENALAITNIQQGLFWLNERTRGRQARGVEGKLVL